VVPLVEHLAGILRQSSQEREGLVKVQAFPLTDDATLVDVALKALDLELRPYAELEMEYG
jgi:hypothetical protein